MRLLPHAAPILILTLALVTALGPLAGCAATSDTRRTDWGALPFRSDERPEVRTVPTGPGLEQVDQLGAPHLQEEIFQLARALPEVIVRSSEVAGPDARALTLEAQFGTFSPDGFITGREFAYFMPPDDSSIHMALPPDIAIDVLNKGWGQRLETFPRGILIYGPRDRDEMRLIWKILRASYDYARSGVDD